MTDFNAVEIAKAIGNEADLQVALEILDRLAAETTSDLPGVIGTLMAKLALIEALCLRHAHPGVNSGAHDLACKVLRIIRGENHA